MHQLFFRALCLSTLCFLFTAAHAQVFTSDDITVSITTTGSHDDTYCQTLATPVFAITVNNSYPGDTLQIVDLLFPATTPWTIVNTSGQNPWNIVESGGLSMRDQDILNDTAYFTFDNLYFYKLVTDHDTLTDVTPAPFDFYVPDHCPHAPLSGKVYVDQNNDCVFNAGDQLLSQAFVKTDVYGSDPNIFNYAEYGPVDPNGDYEVRILTDDMDSVVVQLQPELQFLFSVNSCGQAVQSFTALPQSGADFPLHCTSDVDLYTTGGAAGVVRPNIPFLFYPFVANTGCNATSGTLKLVLDPHVTYDPLLSSNPATGSSGDTLMWSYGDLSNLAGNGYWNGFGGSIHLTPDLTTNIGDVLCFTILTDIPATDVNPANNAMTICLPVVNSYDPNMKQVTPPGTGPIGAIDPETEKLTYTIHFQNTGNAEAYNISVVDTLDPALDPATLRILSTSHTMSPEWLTGNIVRFNFPNIYLADSASNEPASHGFVTFEIALDDNLPLETEIENTGYIFFDFNDAIVTNTTINTLSELAGISGNNTLPANVFPNPASETVTIEAKEIVRVALVDFSGKTVLRVAELNNGQLDISQVGNGIYFMQIETLHGTVVRKLVIAH